MTENQLHHVPDTSKQVTNHNSNETVDDFDDTITSETSKKLVKKTRFIKFFNTIIFILIVGIIVAIVPTFSTATGYHLVAYVIGLNYLVGGVYFLSILLTSKHLHLIYVKRKHIEGYNNFVAPQCTIADREHTIKSVSALTATFGSNIHGLFSRAAYASVGAAFTAIIIHFNEDKESISDSDRIASILMIIAIFGNGLYGTWELEGPNNYMTIFCHYSCAPLIFIMQTLAYSIQSGWSPLSIILFTIGLILDIIYVIILYRLPETSKDLKEVHRISFYCIITEFAALCIPCFSVVAFVYGLK